MYVFLENGASWLASIRFSEVRATYPPGARVLRMLGADLLYIVEEFVVRTSTAQAGPANAVNTAVFQPFVFQP